MILTFNIIPSYTQCVLDERALNVKQLQTSNSRCLLATTQGAEKESKSNSLLAFFLVVNKKLGSKI